MKKEYRDFKGIDLRRKNTAADYTTVRSAVNVDLTTAGSFKRRDALVQVAELHEESIGLYTANGFLRAAVPDNKKFTRNVVEHLWETMPVDADGNEITVEEYEPGYYEKFEPFNVRYDPIRTNSDPYPAAVDGYKREILASTTFGSERVEGGFPLLLVKGHNNLRELHWLNKNKATHDDAEDGYYPTRINPKFNIGDDMVKLQGKIYLIDTSNDYIRYCATLRPDAWDASGADAGDAGFLNVKEHAVGDRDIVGLFALNGQLVVVFENSVQVWAVDPDESLNRLVATYSGPGTHFTHSISVVTNDLYYLSEGGFRSLVTQTVTGERREGDIGAPIQQLTDAETTAPVASIWSQARSQYLCVYPIGENLSRVYAFTSSSISEKAGWTTWEIPISVDYMVEMAGKLYFRTGVKVYEMQEIDKDFGSDDVEFELTTQHLMAGAKHNMKNWDTLDVEQEGTSVMRYYPNPSEPALFLDGPTIVGSTNIYGGVPLMMMSHSMSMRFTGKDLWQLDAFSLNFRYLQGRNS